MKIKVVSGRIDYTLLNSKLSEIEYANAKAHVWLYMLNDGKKPRKWLKANSKGTKVDFDYIYSQSDYDEGLLELEGYLAEINARFDLDFNLKRKDGEGN